MWFLPTVHCYYSHDRKKLGAVVIKSILVLKESDLKSCANSLSTVVHFYCRELEKERLTGWHHAARLTFAAYGLYRIAGDEWVRHEKLPDSWEIGQVVQWGGNAVSSVKLCQKLHSTLFLQTKKFKELNVQLKQICGINSSVILLRHIHKFLQVIVKEHSHPIYKYHTYKVSFKGPTIMYRVVHKSIL